MRCASCSTAASRRSASSRRSSPAWATSPRLLRPGFITRSQIEEVVGPLAVGGDGPRVPGDRLSHYAPSTPLEIVAADELEARAGEIGLARGQGRGAGACDRRCTHSGT